jgi:hypothetical protein
MKHLGEAQGAYHIFNGSISCRRSGLCGFTVRVVPSHADLVSPYDTSLIRWEETQDEKTKTKVGFEETV